MPRGASPKREREYRELKHRFKQEHRYPGREEEVASRIVNKQRRMYGETTAEKAKDGAGKSPDRDLPIPNYQHLTAPQATRKAARLPKRQIQQVKRYEQRHKNRKSVLAGLDRALARA
jgi:hypothetical protein